MFFDRPKDEEYEEEPVDAEFLAAMTPEQRAQYQARREADYQAWLADQQKENSKQKSMFVNAPVLLIAGLGFVEALILLFMTQNFEAPMVIIDNWTVVFALILFVQLLTPMVAAVIHNSLQENKKQKLAAKARTSAAGNEVTL
jgi:Na+-transporting methylmalonyl-CoA/oxaloacetate decarboxylase gamma subunit